MTYGNSSPQFRDHLLHQIDAILRSCEEARRPLEVDPARSELFELFATAEQAGGLDEDAEPDLSADAICKGLAERWGLKSATENWLHQNTNLGPEQLSKMRSLWSLLRMWMEWTYAWQRWPDFHKMRPSPETTASDNP